MNSYSLSSDSTRWPWSSAFGGGLALTVVAVLGVLVGTDTAAAQNHFRDDPPVQPTSTILPLREAPCFERPLTWSVALDGPVPVCAHPRGPLPAFSFDVGSATAASSEAAPPAHIQQILWIEQGL